MTFNYDWRKEAAQAAAQGAPVDQEQLERAFMEQAYTALQNKCGPLLQAPYRLGFETVYKNDTNNRMVGIFAFRVNDELLYAPTFFLNGEIKGTDLLYRHTPKTFVPLNEDWVKYLIEKANSPMGRATPRSFRQDLTEDIALDRIAMPPGVKMAAVASFEDMKTERELSAGLLKEFMGEQDDLKAFDKFANWLENYEFAEALEGKISEEDYMVMPKQAAAVEPPAVTLRLYVGQPSEGMTEEQVEAFYKQGSLIDDKRPEKAMSVVYDDNNPQTMDTPSEPGLYKILDVEGDSVEAYIGFKADRDISSIDSTNPRSCYPNECYSSSPSIHRSFIVVTKDGAYAKTYSCDDQPIGELVSPMSDLIRDEEGLVSTMSSGSAYCVFDPETGEFYTPFQVLSKRSVGDGVSIFKVRDLSQYGSEYEIRHNPDYEGFEPSRGVLGARLRFVKVKTEEKKDEYEHASVKEWKAAKPFSLATKDILDGWIYGTNLKKASLYCDQGSYSVRTAPMLQTDWGTEMQARLFLVKDLGIAVDTANEMLSKAAATSCYKFALELPENTKVAGSVMRVMESPNFQQGYDSDFGVQVDYPQMFDLDTEASYMEPPASRIGDAYDPTLGGPGNYDSGDMEELDSLPEEMLMNAPPEMLPQLAQQMGVPHVLDHGIVGNLISAYDSVAMMEKYIPKMEAAVDVMGRSLFLFYWKPLDFEKAYGSDDMQQLESEIVSNFKAFGDLVLNLLRRNRKRQTSSPSRGV